MSLWLHCWRNKFIFTGDIWLYMPYKILRHHNISTFKLKQNVYVHSKVPYLNRLNRLFNEIVKVTCHLSKDFITFIKSKVKLMHISQNNLDLRYFCCGLTHTHTGFLWAVMQYPTALSGTDTIYKEGATSYSGVTVQLLWWDSCVASPSSVTQIGQLHGFFLSLE